MEVFFGRFQVIHRIAFGAFSAVYKVIDTTANQVLCLKIEKKDSPSYLLEHEFKIAQSLPSTPNTCKSYNYFEDDTQRGVTEELLGDVLSNIRRKRRDPPSIPMVLNIAKECLRGIDVLHKNGILHHDIKPSNFAYLLDKDDYHIVIFDYGLAQYEGEEKKITQFREKLDQNPRYLSCEAAETKKYQVVDDIISLLYTLADFWKGELPWDGRTTANLIKQEKVRHEIKELLPPELGFLYDYREMSAGELAEMCTIELSKMKRDIAEEIRYLSAPQDEGYTPKVKELVFEKGAKKKFKNQHSA